MEGLILVQLRNSGIAQLYQTQNLTLKAGDCVIVEHDRGLDYGTVVLPGHARCCAQDCPKEPPKKIIRMAKESDLKQVQDNIARAKEAFGACEKKILEHKLDMKLVRAEDRKSVV